MKKIAYLILVSSISFVFATSPSSSVGDFDPEGESSSCVNLQSNLRYRMSDKTKEGDIFQLQDFLVSQVYLKGEPTGYFGVATLQAVKKFQSKQGFSPTGYVGPLTREAISKVSCSSGDQTSYYNEGGQGNSKVIKDQKLPIAKPYHEAKKVELFASSPVIYASYYGQNSQATIKWKMNFTPTQGCSLSVEKDGQSANNILTTTESYGSQEVNFILAADMSSNVVTGEYVYKLTCFSAPEIIEGSTKVIVKMSDKPYETNTTSSSVDTKKVESSSTWEKKVIVISPNGGEVFTRGKEIPVMWKTTDQNVGTIKIGLREEDTGKEYTVQSGMPNTGYYTIRTDKEVIPDLMTNRAYRIHMWWYPKGEGDIGAVGDKSDMYFKIVE